MPLWEDVADNAFFYFVHSYYVAARQCHAHTSGETVYGVALYLGGGAG